MSYEITARQNGKNVTLSFGQVSKADIRLKITSKSFFGTVSNLYHSARDGNLPVQKDTVSDWDFVEIQMAYYRGVLSALDIHALELELLTASQSFKGGMSMVSKELAARSERFPGPEGKTYDEHMDDIHKTIGGSYSCRVTASGLGGYHAQFFLIDGLLEVVVSSLKGLVKPKYDSREDDARPKKALAGDDGNLNYARHLHYQFTLASIGIDMSTANALHVLEKFITKPKIDATPLFLPPVDLWKEGPDPDTMHVLMVKGKKGPYGLRRYLVKGKTHMSVEPFKHDGLGYHSPLDKHCPKDNAEWAVRANRFEYFHKKLADMGIDMDIHDLIIPYITVLNKEAKKVPLPDLKKCHYKFTIIREGKEYHLDFADHGINGVNLLVTIDVPHLPTGKIEYNSQLDPSCPSTGYDGSIAVVNELRLKYFKKKLDSLQLEMRPLRWEQIHNLFIKKEEPMQEQQEVKFEQSSFRPRNMIPVLLGMMPAYPNGELVPDEVRDALKHLIEDRSFRIVGLVDNKKFDSPAVIASQGPSYPPPEVREISFFANEKDGYPLSNFSIALKGVSFEFMLIEPDPTQKVVARAWMFSNAHISAFIGVKPIRDLSLSLEERSTEVEFVFKGEQISSSTTMLLANKILSVMHVASANPHIRKL